MHSTDKTRQSDLYANLLYDIRSSADQETHVIVNGLNVCA